MSYTTDHKQKFADLDHHFRHLDQLRRYSNGGNSILFSYPPNEEKLYIEEAKKRYNDKAAFIDVSKLLVQFIDKDGWESFREYFNEFISTPCRIFRSEDPEPDLFKLIIKEVESTCRSGRIPFLIRTGCLFGTGIENVNIMEHKVVMKMRCPLVIFYPSKIEEDSILFLNFRPASRYRCILVK